VKELSINSGQLRNDYEIDLEKDLQNLDRLVMYRKYLQCTSPNFEGWANYDSICACCLILYKSRGTCTHIAHRVPRARVNMPENVETTAVRLDHAMLQPIRLPRTIRMAAMPNPVPGITTTLLSHSSR